ncbi:MAG: hypothetical protein QUS33_07150 [Dehalococcoidia bacterium]|nr:hypothetical protein [Dehalococcoidia bacterium]
MTLAAIYAILVGVAMIAQWSLSYATRKIPELRTEPIRIRFHIAGEAATALSLVAAGIGLLSSQGWGCTLYLVAMGMLFYTAMVSPGYFAQQGKWQWTVVFAVLIALGIVGVLTVA